MSEACDREQENAKKPKVLEQIPKVSGTQLAQRRHCWLHTARSADAELPFEGRVAWQAPQPREACEEFKVGVMRGA